MYPLSVIAIAAVTDPYGEGVSDDVQVLHVVALPSELHIPAAQGIHVDAV